MYPEISFQVHLIKINCGYVSTMTVFPALSQQILIWQNWLFIIYI